MLQKPPPDFKNWIRVWSLWLLLVSSCVCVPEDGGWRWRWPSVRLCCFNESHFRVPLLRGVTDGRVRGGRTTVGSSSRVPALKKTQSVKSDVSYWLIRTLWFLQLVSHQGSSELAFSPEPAGFSHLIVLLKNEAQGRSGHFHQGNSWSSWTRLHDYTSSTQS